MTSAWRIGTTTVHKILETEADVPVIGALDTDDEGLLDRHPWLFPHFAKPGGTFVLSFTGC
ncbi:hypothetical protein [Yinghuangia soli]|uniref:Uncharacterized protein n=1 Tax=Yinghuangia soli TaxID=2908204 RepID=A0AA41Q5D0_9ACTN|nr:hypothetical protein [Yinghuangia soli]MCF2530694.1 hypothetical protein [Yinghuangia soli]